MKKLFSLRGIMCVTLSLLIALLSMFTVAADNDATTADGANVSSEETEDEGYELVAESSGTKMFADMKTGLFKLVTANGTEFYSVSNTIEDDEITTGKSRRIYASQLAIDYAMLDGFGLSGSVNTTNSKTMCDAEVEKIENGIRVTFTFNIIEAVVPVEYVLVDGKLNATIVTKDIKEGEENAIISINLLPSFTAASSTDTGYIFVPDGSGALMNFNSGKDYNTYDKTVYGSELTVTPPDRDRVTEEEIRMPVFGLCQPGVKAFLGNIIEGDGSANIMAAVGNKDLGQNVCSSKLMYRTIVDDIFKTADGGRNPYYRIANTKYGLDKYTVQYTLLDADKSDYSALANAYREYLTKDLGIGKNDKANLINVDAYGALETAANFMGIKYTKLKPLTSYEDLTKILDSLKEKGIDDPAFRYIGWQNDGITNKKQLKKNKLVGVLGGNSGWKKLQSYVDENNVKASYDADLLTYRKSFLNNATATPFNKKAYQYSFIRSTYTKKYTWGASYLLIQDKVLKNSETYLKSINDSVKNISLSSLTNTLYSDFKENRTYHRSLFPDMTVKILKSYKDAGYEISGSDANAYVFPYITTVYDAPTSSSSFLAFDRDVMFYQMVLKGVISTTSSPRQTEDRSDDEFLKAVETGSALLYNGIYENATAVRRIKEQYLYGADYKLWQDAAAEHFEKYNKLYDSVKEKTIANNEEISYNVMRTVFENGVTVTVNYNFSDVTIDTGVIKARSFQVGEGGTAQ